MPQYSGGRSRLHLIDLSYVNQNFEEKGAPSQAPSHAALGQIIVNMLNGNKKGMLFNNSKISRLLRDSIGNQTCRTTVIAHVSAEEKSYKKTLQTLNVTQKIQRKRRKRNKVCLQNSLPSESLFIIVINEVTSRSFLFTVHIKSSFVASKYFFYNILINELKLFPR